MRRTFSGNLNADAFFMNKKLPHIEKDKSVWRFKGKFVYLQTDL